MLGRIHHVAYVVADIDAGLDRLGATFGLTPAVREVMEEQGVEAVLCGTPGGAVELIRPLDPEGAIARFLDSRGEGLHHSRSRWTTWPRPSTTCAAAAPSSSTSGPVRAWAATWWRSSTRARPAGC